MTRTIKLLCAIATAATLSAGCGWPDTKMQPVGTTQMQSQQPAAPATSASDETKKKTNG